VATRKNRLRKGTRKNNKNNRTNSRKATRRNRVSRRFTRKNVQRGGGQNLKILVAEAFGTYFGSCTPDDPQLLFLKNAGDGTYFISTEENLNPELAHNHTHIHFGNSKFTGVETFAGFPSGNGYGGFRLLNVQDDDFYMARITQEWFSFLQNSPKIGSINECNHWFRLFKEIIFRIKGETYTGKSPCPKTEDGFRRRFLPKEVVTRPNEASSSSSAALAPVSKATPSYGKNKPQETIFISISGEGIPIMHVQQGDEGYIPGREKFVRNEDLVAKIRFIENILTTIISNKHSDLVSPSIKLINRLYKVVHRINREPNEGFKTQYRKDLHVELNKLYDGLRKIHDEFVIDGSITEESHGKSVTVKTRVLLNNTMTHDRFYPGFLEEGEGLGANGRPAKKMLANYNRYRR